MRDIETMHENNQIQNNDALPAVRLFNAASESDFNLIVEIKSMLTCLHLLYCF